MKKRGTELCRGALTQLAAREGQGKGTEPIDEKEMLRQLAGPPPLWSQPWVAEDIPNARWKYEIKCGQAVYAETSGFALAEYIAAISPSVIRRFLDEFDREVEARLKAEARIAELERQLSDLTSARSV